MTGAVRCWSVSIGIAAGLATAGCATPAMRDPSVHIVPGRLIALPTTGIEWEWDANGTKTVSNEESELAMNNLDASINYRLSQRGGRSYGRSALEAFEWGAPFREWSLRMMREIMSERLGHARVWHKSVSDWRYGPGLAASRDPLAADYVLVSLFLAGRNTTGRAVLTMLGGGYLAARRAIACIVRMEDGRVVWCNFLERTIAELQLRSGAQIVADRLLLDLLSEGGEAEPIRPAAGPVDPAEDTE